MTSEMEKQMEEIKAMVAQLPEEKRAEYTATIKGIAIGASIGGKKTGN